jgi:hypothetical protein
MFSASRTVFQRFSGAAMRNAAAQRALATTVAKSYSKSTLFAVALFRREL